MSPFVPSPSPRAARVALTLLPALLLSLGCTTSEATARPEAADASKPSAPAPGGGAGAGPRGLSEEAFAARLPGVSPAGLDATQRAAFVEVAEDTLCDCGAPTTLAGCLTQKRDCALGQRMGELARRFVKMGASPLETTDVLEDYFAAFPKSRRKTFDLSTAACQGPEGAPITLVEFADFECPMCGYAWPVLHDLLKAHAEKVRLCFLHFPLSQHPNARHAARLAQLAHQRGQFDLLATVFFGNQSALDKASLVRYAAQAGISADEANALLGSDQLDEIIEQHRAQGLAAGIQGTPSIFINGRRFNLPVDRVTLELAVEDELRWTSNGGKW